MKVALIVLASFLVSILVVNSTNDPSSVKDIGTRFNEVISWIG